MVAPEEISQADACEHLQQFPVNDPLGLSTPQSLAAAGQAFALDLPTGRAVWVLQWQGDALWIVSAAGRTRGEALTILQAIEQQARHNQAEAVRFQTARPGLLKRAMQAGYKVKGWILEKEI